MTTTASIAELQQARVTLEAGEAVAVTQQLIQALRQCDGDAGVEPPYGPPTASNVILNADGTVTCAACGTTPAISEIAIFLDTLLPPGSPRVPGGLRYLIARGLLEVDVPPFDSLDDFSQALQRHEREPRVEVVRRLVQRAESACAVVRADRRRARTTELRRALREADVRLYAHHLAAERPIGRRPAVHARTMPAIAACLGAGLMLIAAGEYMHERRTAPAASAPVVVAPAVVSTMGTAPAPPVAVPDSPPSEPATALGTANSTPRVERVAVRRVVSDRSDRRPVKRAAPPSQVRDRKARAERSSPGVLDRLRLGWLRRLTKS